MRIYIIIIPKTAVTTAFGLFEFVHMPFGLRNAAQTFQRFLDQVLRDFDFTYAYIDDILVASSDEQEHLQHLRLLFSRLEEYGLTINPTKCIFGAVDIEFLGHRINSSCISPVPDKIDAIKEYPVPQSIKSLRRFLGIINYYCRFIPRCADLLSPLTDLLKLKPEILHFLPKLLLLLRKLKKSFPL